MSLIEFTREELLILKIAEFQLARDALDSAVRRLLASVHPAGKSKYQKLVLTDCLYELEQRAGEAKSISVQP